MTNKLPLSAYIICLDEEEYLANCIESLSQCSEIIILDSGSTDDTLALIGRYKEAGWPIICKHQDWLGYAAQKQAALEMCTQPWCFSIDSDERLDEDLRALLPELLEAPGHIMGWKVARRPYLIGYGYTPKRAHGRKNLRLIRNGKGRFDLSLKVHEGIIPEGEVRSAKSGSLLHFRPIPLDEQILKENKYSSLKADMRQEKGVKPSVLKLIFNPPLYFIRLYLRTGVWRCGVPGFIQAMTGAVYSFLTEAKGFERSALSTAAPFDDMEGLKTPNSDEDREPGP